MNAPEWNPKYQPAPNRRKTPSFSSSLLDSIIRSIDESNDGGLHDESLDQQNQQVHVNDLHFSSSQSKQSSKDQFPKPQSINGGEQIPSLRRAIMIDQWMETHSNNNYCNGFVSGKFSSDSGNNCNGFVSRKFSSDSSSNGKTTFSMSSSSEAETPSTYRSLPNSFTLSRKISTAFSGDEKKTVSTKLEAKFMKSTKSRAMKLYGDLKKVKQPISPGNRISTFLNSIFASSKKAKVEEAMQNFRSLKKSRSIKQDRTTTCSSSSRSCLSKKSSNSGAKRSVRFYPENSTVILDRKSIHERDPSLMPLPKYERKWFKANNYMKNMNNYGKFVIEAEEGDDNEEEDEDDLFELEIVHGGYREELPVFETTDLRKIKTKAPF